MKKTFAALSPLIKISLPAAAAVVVAMSGGGVQSRTASRSTRSRKSVTSSVTTSAPPAHDPIFAFSAPAPRPTTGQTAKQVSNVTTGEEAQTGAYPTWCGGSVTGHSSGALLYRLNGGAGLLGNPELATQAHCSLSRCVGGIHAGEFCDSNTFCAGGGGNTAPTIIGAVAGQAVNDNSTVSPFTGVTIGDVDSPAQTQSVSVTLDTAAKGSFTTLNGFSNAGSGVYTFSGTAANATTAIRGLVFTPAANRVAPGSTETTTFTISTNDGVASAVTNNTTTVVSTSINDSPTITGATAGHAVNDNSTVSPFSSVIIGDVDSPAQTQSVSVTLDTAAKGSFTTLNGFSNAGSGVYTFSGTAANATTAIRGLVFTPAANRVAPGSTETTTFTISTNDGVASAVTNNTTTVVSTSINNAPVFVTATTASFTVMANSSNTDISSYLAITDPDTGSQTETWTVSVATNHGGTVTAGTTATSGAGSRTPTGWYYHPATGFVGTETFTIQVSDGTNTATRAFSITVTRPGFHQLWG